MAVEVHEVDSKLSVHEAVCAERYLGINARLRRIETLFIGFIGAVIMLLLTIIVKMGVH
jgi:hypothetical protein